MNRDSIWATAREMAVLDRQSFLCAIEGCDPAMEDSTKQEIERFKKLKGLPLKAALTADREAVRLAFLSAEMWFDGLAQAQAGLEARRSAGWFKRIRLLRLSLFGQTLREQFIKDAIAVPIHKIAAYLKR